MFEGLKGRKFYNKCKSNLKLIKVRMEAIKKKRGSVEKYLKNDIADLLKESLDINAYGRAEGLIVEMNMSSCYAMVEQFCATILSNIAAMDASDQCPKECREAVPSLMYAAARFADLPELRDLRSLFFQKFGNSLEEFLSNEFVQKLTPEPPTKEEKIQLLRDIAQATSINWDSKALEQKLYAPPTTARSRTKIESTYDDHASKDDYKKQQDSEGAAALKVNKQNSYNRISNSAPKEYTVSESQKEMIHNTREDVEEKFPHQIKDAPQQQQEASAETKKPFYLGLFPRKSPTPPADVKTEQAEQVENNADDKEDKAKPKSRPRSVRSRRPASAAANRENTPQRDSNTNQKNATERHQSVSRRDSSSASASALNPVKPVLQPPPYVRTYGDGPNTARERSGREVKHFGGMMFEPTSSPAEVSKRYGASLDSEIGFDCAHPRVPEYDDLAARIAALSGK